MPYVSLLAALLVSSAACAEGLSVSTLTSSDQLLSATTLDLNHDGKPDQAFLVRGRLGADLYVYISTPGVSADTSRRLVVRKGAAFVGSKVGMLPSLESAGNDQLILKSGNTVFGRNRFEQKLKLTMQEDQLVVSGLSYEKLDPESSAAADRCDLDLLHAEGKVNGLSVTPSVKAAPIATWDVDSPPGECLF